MTGTHSWWQNAVVYQVYLRSFADGNGDGTGDIAGLRSRLAYLRDLGVDAIWINPWYESPFHDGGYDVADYRSIHPLFGTMEEAEQLIADAHRMGLRILADLVPNHTSWEHRWFVEALASPPGSRARARYHFLDGHGADGSEPPNNWQSVFGGPAWTRVSDGQWYLHLFDETQPDLNWANEEVRAEFDDIIRFWLELGADGFRVDVAHALAKDPEYPNAKGTREELLETAHPGGHPAWDQPELHEIARRWRSLLDEYEERVMIAEAWLPSWERLAEYLRPGEYDQAFDFLFLQSPWDPQVIKASIAEALTETAVVGALPTWVLSNHDVVRHPTRYGLPQEVDSRAWLLDGDRGLLDESQGLERARAAILLMLALPGSVYLYQGEELGLHEAYDLPLDVLQDPIWEDSGHERKGRDGCRVPIPWSRAEPSFGFGDGDSWLPQPPDWGDRSVATQTGDPHSTLELYRKALRLRREHLANTAVEWIEARDDVIAFRRGESLSCFVNFGSAAFDLPDGEVILASVDVIDGRLPTDAAAWVLRNIATDRLSDSGQAP